MNSQLPIHSTYTLPGIMHYLQTEFTRNERDRISWELERSEMKARIAQLEGDNRDLMYRLMKLDPGAEREVLKILDKNDASPLIKSKAAVQENVKEIIYLFKSPNILKQMEYLNEKKDPVHELEKLGMNQMENNTAQSEDGNADLERPEEHRLDALQEALQQHDNLDRELDEKSDAGTVVMGSDSENAEFPSQGPRRHRSSSLFTSEELKPLGLKQESQEESINLVQGSVDRSAIIKLKVYQNQVLSYSKTGDLTYRIVDQSFNWDKSVCRRFEGLASELLDIFWLDSETFLTLDNEGIKSWHCTAENPLVARLNIFGDNLHFDEVKTWDFRNSWLLLVLKGKIYLREIVISTDVPRLSIGKGYYFNTNKEVLEAKFGITEKSLILLNKDPDELVIHNFQGKQLQKVDIKKYLSSATDLDSSAQLFLNKKSSKLLILVQKLVLIYSFEQKKNILKQILKCQPTSVIFNSSRDFVVFAYDDGNVELRNVKDFSSIIKKYNQVNDESALDDNTQSLMDSRLKPVDKNPIIMESTEINNHTVIISADSSGRMRLNEIDNIGQ